MIPLSKPLLPSEAEEAVTACIKSGWLGYGPACRSLESRFTEANSGWALATSSCTSALWLAAHLCRKSPEDEVIVPAITFVSTAMAFQCAGFTIRLADVNLETLLVTRKTIEEKLSPKTRAVVVVHLYGQRAMMEEIRELCEERHLLLIEDCAHRLDLLDALQPLGDYACYSFNAVKEAPCGEGGLLWGRSLASESRARAMSNVGLDIDTFQRSSMLKHRDYGFSSEVGLKLRLNDVLASLVNVSLDCLRDSRHRRGQIFNYYDREIQRFAPFALPLFRGKSDSFLMYILRLNGLARERIRADMATEGVATSTHYPSLTGHPLVNPCADRCITADGVSDEILTLPCFLSITQDEQRSVLTALKNAITNQVTKVP